jgi:hypothetical protein
MRVTIKISKQGEQSTLSVRNNLDLYNDPQVEKLIRRTAGKLEVYFFHFFFDSHFPDKKPKKQIKNPGKFIIAAPSPYQYI